MARRNANSVLHLAITDFPREFDPFNPGYSYSKALLEQGNVTLVRTQQEYCDKKAVGHLEHLREMNRLLLSNEFLSSIAGGLKLDARFRPPKANKDKPAKKQEHRESNQYERQAEKLVVLLGCLALGDGNFPLPVKLFLQSLSDQAVAQVFNIEADETVKVETDLKSSETPHTGSTDERSEEATGTSHGQGTKSVDPIERHDLLAPSGGEIEITRTETDIHAEYDESPLAIPDRVFADGSLSTAPDPPVIHNHLSDHPVVDSASALGLHPSAGSFSTELAETDRFSNIRILQPVPTMHPDRWRRSAELIEGRTSVNTSLATGSEPPFPVYIVPQGHSVPDCGEGTRLAPDLLVEGPYPGETSISPQRSERAGLVSTVEPGVITAPSHFSSGEFSSPSYQEAPPFPLPSYPMHETGESASSASHGNNLDVDVGRPPGLTHTNWGQDWRAVNAGRLMSSGISGRRGAIAGFATQIEGMIAGSSDSERSEAGLSSSTAELDHLEYFASAYPYKSTSTLSGSAVPYSDEVPQPGSIMEPSEWLLDPTLWSFELDNPLFDSLPPFRNTSVADPSPSINSLLYSSQTNLDPARGRVDNPRKRDVDTAFPPDNDNVDVTHPAGSRDEYFDLKSYAGFAVYEDAHSEIRSPF